MVTGWPLETTNPAPADLHSLKILADALLDGIATIRGMDGGARIGHVRPRVQLWVSEASGSLLVASAGVSV